MGTESLLTSLHGASNAKGSCGALQTKDMNARNAILSFAKTVLPKRIHQNASALLLEMYDEHEAVTFMTIPWASQLHVAQSAQPLIKSWFVFCCPSRFCILAAISEGFLASHNDTKLHLVS